MAMAANEIDLTDYFIDPNGLASLYEVAGKIQAHADNMSDHGWHKVAKMTKTEIVVIMANARVSSKTAAIAHFSMNHVKKMKRGVGSY